MRLLFLIIKLGWMGILRGGFKLFIDIIVQNNVQLRSEVIFDDCCKLHNSTSKLEGNL